ncbi:MAG: preprotein translocase subunit SecE [Eubacteriales bacterium]
MGEVKTSKTHKKSWFKGLKAEFNKIIWPNKVTLARESTVVIVVAILLGVIISIVDFIIKYGIDIIV